MNLEDLFWLVLLAIYLLLQFVGAKKQQKPTPGRTEVPPDAQRRADPEIDDALREIREMLGFPSSEREPERMPEAVETPLDEADPNAPTRLEQQTSDEPAKTTTGVRTGYALEEQFESRPAFQERFQNQERMTTPITGPAPSPSTAPPPVHRDRLLKRLRSPDGARDAVVLAEILGPPRARKRP